MTTQDMKPKLYNTELELHGKFFPISYFFFSSYLYTFGFGIELHLFHIDSHVPLLVCCSCANVKWMDTLVHYRNCPGKVRGFSKKTTCFGTCGTSDSIT